MAGDILKNENMIDLIKNTYKTHKKERTLLHVEAVANTAMQLAKTHSLDIQKANLAALLHDISAIMTPQEMYTVAMEHNFHIDPAEEKYPFLLHQRISKIIAQNEFHIQDSDILDAIECHTTLKKNASKYDKLIFLSDKISWDQEGIPPYYELIKTKAAQSLDEACYLFIKYQFDNNLLLYPHQWILEAFEDLKNDIAP